LNAAVQEDFELVKLGLVQGPCFGSPQVIRGSGGKISIFQIAPMTKVSTQIHSSMCQYDVYSFVKKMSGRGPSGVSKPTFFPEGATSGLGDRIFAGFQVVSTLYPMLMTPYPPHITTLI